MRVLVTDGEQRSALAVVRSLGRSGHEVYVCSTRKRSLAGASRYASAQAPVPDPLECPQAFVPAIHQLVGQWGAEALVPVAEPSLLALLGDRGRFADLLFPFPGLQRFRQICDKRQVLQVAESLGIAVPEQVVLESPQQLDRLPAALADGPIVLKPFRSVAEGEGRRHRLGVTYAEGAEELRASIAALRPAAFPVMLQQRVVGPGVGIFLLLWDGQTRAVFAHRRIREKPPSGGVSVYRESVPPNPTMVDRSRALLERFDWQGVAMVEYKVESATGIPYLMEVNGRFWGSLQLAIDAGVDFPALLLDAARGRTSAGPPDYRTGVRSRWWWGDVDQLITRLRRSDRELALPPDAPSRLRALLDFSMLWRPGDCNEIFRWSDPAPSVRESIDWLARR